MLVTGVVVFIAGMGVSLVSTIAAICIFSAAIVFFIIRSTLINRVRVVEEGSQQVT